MKSIIKLKNPSKERLLAVLEHLLKHGYNDFIVFSTFFKDVENDICEIVWQSNAKIVFLKSYNQGTEDCLQNIKGSLTDSFFVVYNDEISEFDLKNAYNFHRAGTKLATLLSTEKRMVGAFFESEIFDYMTTKNHFEKEIIARIFEDDEVQIYLYNNSKY